MKSSKNSKEEADCEIRNVKPQPSWTRSDYNVIENVGEPRESKLFILIWLAWSIFMLGALGIVGALLVFTVMLVAVDSMRISNYISEYNGRNYEHTR